MFPTLSPRPWMPLCRRRSALRYTSVPRAVRRQDRNRRPRAASHRATAQRRSLLRRRLSARELRHRIDELTAETEAWIAALENERDARRA